MSYAVSIELQAKVRDYVTGFDNAIKATNRLEAAQRGAVRSSSLLASELTDTGRAARQSSGDVSAMSRSVGSLARNTNSLAEAQARLKRVGPVNVGPLPVVPRAAAAVSARPAPPPPAGGGGGGNTALFGLAGIAALGSAGGGLNALPPLLAATGTAAGALPGIFAGAALATSTLKVSMIGLGDAVGEVFKTDDPFERLSPSARALVSQLQEAKPALLAFQEGLQDRALRGTAASLDLLVTRTLPKVSASVGLLADDWANAFAEITLAVSDPTTTQAFATIAGSADQFFDQITTRIRPAAAAISTLAVAADPVAQAVGEKLVGAIDKFVAKVEEAKQSGSLDEFFAAGAESAAAMAQAGSDVLTMTAQLITELTKQDAATGNAGASLQAYVASGRSAADVAGIVHTLTTAYEGMAAVLGPLGALIRDALADPATAQSLEQLLTILSAGTQVLATVAQLFLDINNATGGIALTLLGLGIVAQKTATGIALMGAAAGRTSAQLATMGAVGATAGRGLTGLAGGAGKALAAFVALELAHQVVDQFQDDAVNVKALDESIRSMADGGAIAGEAVRLFGNDLSDIGKQAKFATDDNFFASFLRGAEEALPITRDLAEAFGAGAHTFTGAAENFAALDASLAEYAERTKDYTGAQEVFNQAYERSGLTLEAFSALVPASTTVLADLHREAETGAGSMTALAERTTLLNAPLEETVTLGRDVIGIFNELNGTAIGFAEAQLTAESAIDGLVAGLKENKLALDANKTGFDVLNEKGAENLKLTLDLAKSAAAAAQAKLDETGSVEAAAGVYDQYINRLRVALAAQGASPATIQAIISKYAEMPAALGAAADSVTNLNGKLKSIPKGTTFTFNGKSIVDATGNALTLKGGIEDLPPGKTFTFNGKSLVDGRGKVYALDTAVRNIRDSASVTISVPGYGPAMDKLNALFYRQQALKNGTSPGTEFRKFRSGTLNAPGGWALGGWTGPGGKYEPAGVVHRDEFVIQKESRQRIETLAPGLLDQMNRFGRLPAEFVPDERRGYATGGRVSWPFPVNAKVTKIPTWDEVAAKVAAFMPTSGATAPFIVSLLKKNFADVPILSVFRKGSRTLSGNLSLHAQNRAVDTAPNVFLAKWFYENYKSRLREHITPFPQYNVLRGRDHRYTGAVWRQHNFAGGNAHNHIAMAGGGVIREPVMGVGASGRTYSFGEVGPETVVPGVRGYAGGGRVRGGLVGFEAPEGAKATRLDYAESYLRSRDALTALNAALKENGRSFSTATAKGKENRAALYAAIRAAQEAAKTKYDETGSVRRANAAYAQHIAMLRRTLSQQRVNARTIRSLVGVAGRPDYDTTTARPNNSLANIAFARSAISAVSNLEDLRDKLSLSKPTTSTGSAEGRENLGAILSAFEAAAGAAQDRFTQTGNARTARTLYTKLVMDIRKALAASGYSGRNIGALTRAYGRITLQRNAIGGVYGPLGEAMALPAGNTLYAFREPSTGGEAFIPRRGNDARAERVLQIAAGWRGGTYVPAGSGGGRSTTHQTNLTVNNYGEPYTPAKLARDQRRIDVMNRVGRNR